MEKPDMVLFFGVDEERVEERERERERESVK